MCYLAKQKKGDCTRGPRPTSSLRRGPAQNPWPAPRCPARRMPFVRGGGGAAGFRANRLCNQCHQHDTTSVLVAPAICKLIRFSDRHTSPPHTASHCRPNTPTYCNSPEPPPGPALVWPIFAQIGCAANVVNMTPLLSWLRQLSGSFYVSPIDMHPPSTPPTTAAPTHSHPVTARGGAGVTID